MWVSLGCVVLLSFLEWAGVNSGASGLSPVTVWVGDKAGMNGGAKGLRGEARVGWQF